MNFIAFIFALAQRFSPVSEQDMAEMRKEANIWHDKIMASDEKGFLNWKVLYRKYSAMWYVKLLLCYVFMFGVRVIGGWMNEVNNPQQNQSFNNQQKDRW